ncbi:MAG: hypothetical protein DME22_26340 [Verrucomicrobia bacterium]|nr:MAG: hypothetical protein DME22_26340 [Verrucomicrobiota bacterium]
MSWSWCGRKTSTSRDQNLKRGGAKQFPFAEGIRLTGVSDNHTPKGSRGNLALASQIDPSALASGFPRSQQTFVQSTRERFERSILILHSIPRVREREAARQPAFQSGLG